MSSRNVGRCDACAHGFEYQLVHNGFNESAFAYCDTCGCEASLSGWCEAIPAAANLKLHGPVNSEAEALLRPCQCGGRFGAQASPRCPRCNAPLDAQKAKDYIEGNAQGTAGGWRWQGSWQGIYSITIEGNRVQDPWL